MKYLLIFLTLSLPVHAGLNFNLISNEVENILNPFLVGDKLVYQDDNGLLWFNNGSSNSAYKAMVNGQNIKASNLLKTDNSVIFVNQTDGNTLWFTDGEEIGQLSDIPLAQMSGSASNVIAAKLKDSGNFITTDGTEVNFYDIQPRSLNINEEISILPSVCAFDKDNLIFKAVDTNPTNPQTNLYSFQSGTISQIQFESEELNGNSLEFALQSGEYCFYRYFDYQKNIATHYKIDAQGNIFSINNPEFGFFDDYFVFNNQVLLFLNGVSGISGSKGLFTLSEDSVIPEILLSNDQQVLTANSFWSTENFLYLYNQIVCINRKCSPQPPNPYSLMVVDKSFNLVNTIVNARLQNFVLDSADDKDFLIFRTEIDELINLNQGEIVNSVKDPLVNIENVIGGNEQNYYVYGSSRVSNKFGIYKVSEQAVISKYLSGLWVSEELQSQGLSIHSGTRPDGSTYIFVSFYIYRDGLPFWLAGNTELRTGETMQTIDLAEYKGQSFLSNGQAQDFEQIPFGNMTIQTKNCDSIDVKINPISSEVIELSMNRIVDITNSNACSDE